MSDEDVPDRLHILTESHGRAGATMGWVLVVLGLILLVPITIAIPRGPNSDVFTLLAVAACLFIPGCVAWGLNTRAGVVIDRKEKTAGKWTQTFNFPIKYRKKTVCFEQFHRVTLGALDVSEIIERHVVGHVLPLPSRPPLYLQIDGTHSGSKFIFTPMMLNRKQRSVTEHHHLRRQGEMIARFLGVEFVDSTARSLTPISTNSASSISGMEWPPLPTQALRGVDRPSPTPFPSKTGLPPFPDLPVGTVLRCRIDGDTILVDYPSYLYRSLVPGFLVVPFGLVPLCFFGIPILVKLKGLTPPYDLSQMPAWAVLSAIFILPLMAILVFTLRALLSNHLPRNRVEISPYGLIFDRASYPWKRRRLGISKARILSVDVLRNDDPGGLRICCADGSACFGRKLPGNDVDWLAHVISHQLSKSSPAEQEDEEDSLG